MRSILLDHFGIETRHMLSTVAAAVPMAAARASGRRPRLWPRLAAKDQFVIRNVGKLQQLVAPFMPPSMR